jgi:hypothetical protein
MVLVSSRTSESEEAAFVVRCGAGEDKIGVEERCWHEMYPSEPDPQGEAFG